LTSWPADKVERRKVADLIPYARNSRTHSDEQVAQIAASIKEWGWTVPVLIEDDGGLIAGHGRVLAAQKLGIDEVPCMVAGGWSEAQKRAYIIADNKLALNAGWDDDMLKIELGELGDLDFDLSLTGFDDDELSALLAEEGTDGLTDEDAVPEVPEVPVTVEGDVWLLGRHRLMCGDSTSIDAVDKLMDGAIADLVHADPPYGMGKEADGVLNDNLYAEKLDKFQMDWWNAFRPSVSNKAGVYIWGNAPDLWRLWYSGGLGSSEKMQLKNHITWDKKAIPGMKSPLLNCFPVASEHCLIFMLGDQLNGNVNTDGYFDGWDEVRLYLKAEADACGITSKTLTELCGCQMYSHWFTKSQWSLISDRHYKTLSETYPHSFKRPWSELKKIHDKAQKAYRAEVKEKRAYFDNSHEVMRDTWEFPRVSGSERFGHATPKPVGMMVRVMLTSLPEGGLCIEPFGGSGSTLMGAEVSKRNCYTMELDPKYCDVIIQRWQDFTGQQATLEATGQTYAELKDERCKAAA